MVHETHNSIFARVFARCHVILIAVLLAGGTGSGITPYSVLPTHAKSPSKPSVDHERNFGEACDAVKNRNFKHAHSKLQDGANQGHPKSLTLQGMLYERGLGVEKDVAKAAQCYKRAAQKGLPEAESRLGHLLLESGKAVQKDAQSATYWLEKSAQHGVAEAQATLGKLYYEGNHLPINNSEAVRWLRQAADQGHVEAQQMLNKIPVLKQANERFHSAGDQYATGMGNLEKSWQGYADIVNSVNQAASYQPKR